jgi:hypothetical protein
MLTGEPWVRSEKLGNTFNGKAFRHIYMLTSAVIAPPRQAFRVLIGQDRPLRFQHRFADDIFRGDELDLIALAGELASDDVSYLGVGLGQRHREKVGGIGVGSRRIAHGHHAVGADLHARRFAGR